MESYCGTRDQCPFQRSPVHTLNQFVMDVAKADTEIIARGLEIPAAQLLVDRHHRKIGFRQRFGDVHHPFKGASSDQIEPMREVAPRFKPRLFLSD